jgi:hypothetical protein
MRSILSAIAVLLLCAGAASAAPGDAVSGQDAFEQLKTLAGSWSGTAEGQGEEAEAEAQKVDKVVHDFRVSAASTLVMEIMGPDSQYEMINMYHLDGEDLVLTHYCAAGNQPTMRLDSEKSTPQKLVFAFTGGTNLDPAVDSHIHSAEITLVDDDTIVSDWTSWSGGKEYGGMTFSLKRDG